MQSKDPSRRSYRVRVGSPGRESLNRLFTHYGFLRIQIQQPIEQASLSYLHSRLNSACFALVIAAFWQRTPREGWRTRQ